MKMNRNEISLWKFSGSNHPVDSVNTEATLIPQVPWIITVICWCKSHLPHSFLHHPKGPLGCSHPLLQPGCWLPTYDRSIMPQHHWPEAPWVLTAVPEVSELLTWLSALWFPRQIWLNIKYFSEGVILQPYTLLSVSTFMGKITTARQSMKCDKDTSKGTFLGVGRRERVEHDKK